MSGLYLRLRSAVLSVPLPQSRRRRAADSQDYWNRPDGERWASDSHVRGALPRWERIGPEHLEMFERFARGAGTATRPARVLEWGSGGGANAVAFAPLAEEFIAVDVVPESLAECRRQVEAVCDTTFTPVLVGVDTPEDVRREVDGEVDLVLCLYVVELLPSKDHARRMLRVTTDLLRAGGAALVQVKYQTSSLATRPRTWSYRRQVAAMTTFQIHEFWLLAGECGLTPRLLTLVPRTDYDERYAYYFLTKDVEAPSGGAAGHRS